MEDISLSDITVGGQPLEDNSPTPTDESPTVNQEETQVSSETTQESDVQQESFNDEADIADSEFAEEVDSQDYDETSSTESYGGYSEEEMQSASEFIGNYTNNVYSSADELIDAHDILYDQVEELKAQLEQNQSAQPQVEEYDEFLQGLIDYYKSTGDVTPYLEAKSVDYTSMSDLDVVRYDMRKQYPEMSDKNFERLFDREVIQKYQLDENRYGEDEIELGKELLKSEASRKRQSLIEDQSKFAIPQREDNSAQTQAEAEQARQQWTQSVQSHPTTKELLDNQRVVINYNGEPFAYEVDNTDAVVEMTIDNTKFFQLFQTEDGQVDYDRWYRVLNYASNPGLFERSLINHGKTLGGKEVVKEIKNPSRPQRGSSSSTGDSNEDFLRAALNALGR
jgi:hypothetical protein